MKTCLTLVTFSFLFCFLIVGCNKNNAENELFIVEIVNKSLSEIKDIELSMVGAKEDIFIKKLAPGQSTEKQNFTLPIIDGQNPDSWGDYFGVYSQKNIPKDICILNYEHNFRTGTRIEIEDSSYSIIYFP